MSATHDDVESVLDSRQEWLLEKVYGLKEQEGPPYPKEHLSGERLPYRGRQYPLEVVEADVPEPELSFDEQTFTLRVHRFDADADQASVRRGRQAIVDWFVNRAAEELPDRGSRLESRLGLDDVPVEVGEMESRWGEYNDGVVRLNWRLVLAPVRIPDYEERREWLWLNGNTLSV